MTPNPTRIPALSKHVPRRDGCPHFLACVNQAAESEWWQFSCAKCPLYRSQPETAPAAAPEPEETTMPTQTLTETSPVADLAAATGRSTNNVRCIARRLGIEKASERTAEQHAALMRELGRPKQSHAGLARHRDPELEQDDELDEDEGRAGGDLGYPEPEAERSKPPTRPRRSPELTREEREAIHAAVTEPAPVAHRMAAGFAQALTGRPAVDSRLVAHARLLADEIRARLDLLEQLHAEILGGGQ